MNTTALPAFTATLAAAVALQSSASSGMAAQVTILKNKDEADTEKEIILAAVHSEKMPFYVGQAKLVDNGAKSDLLEFTRDKRKVTLGAVYGEALDLFASLKSQALSLVSLAMAGQAEERQGEIGEVMHSWGDGYVAFRPCLEMAIFWACPDLQKLEALRLALEECRAENGFSALLQKCQELVSALDGIPIADDEVMELEDGGSGRQNFLIGIRENSTYPEIISFQGRNADADEDFALAAKPGFLGYRQIRYYRQVAISERRDIRVDTALAGDRKFLEQVKGELVDFAAPETLQAALAWLG